MSSGAVGRAPPVGCARNVPLRCSAPASTRYVALAPGFSPVSRATTT